MVERKQYHVCYRGRIHDVEALDEYDAARKIVETTEHVYVLEHGKDHEPVRGVEKLAVYLTSNKVSTKIIGID